MSCSTAQVHSAMPTRSIPEAPKLQMPPYSRHAAVAPMVSTSQRVFHCIFPLSVSSLTALVIFPSPLPFSPLPHSSPRPLPQDMVFEIPLRRLSEEEQEEMGIQYYDSDVHKAPFTLPRFAKKEDTLMVASTCTGYGSPVTLNLNY